MSNTAHDQVDVERCGELNVFTLLRKQIVRHFADTVEKYLVIFSTEITLNQE